MLEPAPPPRHVPLSALLRVRLGGVVQQMGFFLVGFGLVFGRVLGQAADVESLLLAADTVDHVQGEVLHSEETGYSVGGDEDEAGEPVYALTVRYTWGNETHETVSYTQEQRPVPGTRLEVEVPEGAPDRGVVSGARRRPFSAFVLFVWLFPLAGLLMVYFPHRAMARRAALLSTGVFTRGKLVDKQATSARINERPVYALTFEFLADDGSAHRVTTRTHEPEHLEDDPLEGLLYDRHHPDRATTLDDLPGGVRFDARGHLMPTRGVLAVLLLPGLWALIHLVWWWLA